MSWVVMRNAALILLALWVTLAVPLAGCAPAEDAAWTRIKETGVLRVGMDASFPPFESVAADGTLVGFDVELARELGRRLGAELDQPDGMEVTFVANLPYDGLYDALTAGRVDIVISALVIDPARMDDFAYSTSYFDAGQVLVAPAGEDEIEALTDLGGHTMAVALGTRGDREARQWARRLADFTVVSHPTAAEALASVAAGEADVALVDHVSALQAVGSGRELTVMGRPVVEAPYAVATRQENWRLLQAIDEALAAMERDGTLDALVDEWLRGDR